MLDFRIIHDGKHWIAERDGCAARGRTLAELDSALAEVVGRHFDLEGQTEVDVRMTFDNVTIPEWIRQYANHYFNRVVTLSL
jgi:hypothetical protein